MENRKLWLDFVGEKKEKSWWIFDCDWHMKYVLFPWAVKLRSVIFSILHGQIYKYAVSFQSFRFDQSNPPHRDGMNWWLGFSIQNKISAYSIYASISRMQSVMFLNAVNVQFYNTNNPRTTILKLSIYFHFSFAGATTSFLSDRRCA